MLIRVLCVTGIILGCATFSANGLEAADKATNREITGLFGLVPIMMTRPLDAPNKLLFVWSRDCKTCPEVFYKFVWPLMSDSSKTKATVVSVVQYEPQPGEIKRIVELQCTSQNTYAWSAMRYLLRDSPFAQLGTLPKHLDTPKSRSERSQFCSNRAQATTLITEFMKDIRKQANVTQLPLIERDGRVLLPPYDELWTPHGRKK